MNWLKDSVVELMTRLFNYLFKGEHMSSAKIDAEDDTFQKKIQEEK
jgi:hypothetical protein